MMNEELERMIKYIHMKGLLTNWDQYLKLAAKKNFSHIKLLEYIVKEEYKIKKENSRILRINRAKIPEKYVLETFPFSRQPNLNKKKIINTYDSFSYIPHKQNIMFIGPTGSGKTGLATSFLTQAINKGFSGRFILFPELIEMLYSSRGDRTEKKVIRTFANYDCLLIDELGYVEVEAVQVGLFFTLMHKRHRRKCTIITSNLGFSQWVSFLKNEQLTAALIDRLTEKSYVINMKKCVSLRPKGKIR